MKYSLILTIQFLFIMSLTSFAQDLSQYRWENRIILMITPDENHSEFKQQIANLSGLDMELEDMKLVSFVVTPTKYSLGLGMDEWHESTVLYERYQQKNEEYSTLLIGLDGRVKMWSAKAVGAEGIFELINTMPMRKAELRKRKRKETND